MGDKGVKIARFLNKHALQIKGVSLCHKGYQHGYQTQLTHQRNKRRVEAVGLFLPVQPFFTRAKKSPPSTVSHKNTKQTDKQNVQGGKDDLRVAAFQYSQQVFGIEYPGDKDPPQQQKVVGAGKHKQKKVPAWLMKHKMKKKKVQQ